MEAFLASFFMVAVAEIGDKTQLLSFLLAARYRGRPAAIIAGILVATMLNHALAASAGAWIATHIPAEWLRWILGGSFLGFAAWALVPDRLDDEPRSPSVPGAFLATTLLFFLAEMGDKTQVATVALGARYSSLWLVTVGTTLGMLAANVPAVLLGEKIVTRFPIAQVRFVAAALFAVFAIVILAGTEIKLGD